jgi:hypothetical protein
MKFSAVLGILVTFSGISAIAQTMPTSNGSCGVSPSGLMSCEWLSTPPVRFDADSTKRPKPVPKGLFVTRFTLAPDAPLHRTIEGHDVLIVAMSNGEIANEAKAPQTRLNLTNGQVMLMPKEEPFLFRNTGKQTLDLVVIDVRK